MIIISIIIVFGVVAYFSIGTDYFSQRVDPEIAPINDYVNNCIKEIGKNAVLDTSKYGGYFSEANYALDNGIAYYLNNGNDLTPSKGKIEEELGTYVDNILGFCIDEFTNFEDYSIDAGEIKTYVEISKDVVSFEVNYPLSIVKGESTYNLELFSVEISSRLFEIYEGVKFIMNEQVLDQKSICVTCLHQVSSSYDFYVDAIPIDENNVIYTIRDETLKINNEPLVFNFAVELEEA